MRFKARLKSGEYLESFTISKDGEVLQINQEIVTWRGIVEG